MISILTVGLLLGCPKDRTGTSATQDLMNSIAEVDSLILKMNEVERRISQIESVTRARSQDEMLKLESMDQVLVEMANMRGEMEQIHFQMEQMDGTVKGQQEDAQFRLDWLEQRAVFLENSLGLTTPAPGQTVDSTTSVGSASNTLDSGPASVQQPTGIPTNEHIVKGERTVETANPEAQNNIGSNIATTQSPTEQTQSTSTPEQLLKLAKEHLVAGREEAAEAVLNRLLKEHPRSSIEPEVRYRLAEAAFNSKNYPESARRFQDVLNRHPKSPFASWSLLRQGECFEAMGQGENASIFYNDVITEYPKSKAAAEAKSKLK